MYFRNSGCILVNNLLLFEESDVNIEQSSMIVENVKYKTVIFDIFFIVPCHRNLGFWLRTNGRAFWLSDDFQRY